jgi:hypothetical protein
VFVFLDFEASSLARQSYPIEVGWVDESGAGEGHLIRPAPGWSDWDERAAAVHGISRDQLLREGEPHDAVCERLLAVFARSEVLAGAPSWDGHWLSMLLRAAGHPRHLVRLRDSEEAFIAAARARLGPGAAGTSVAALVEEIRRSVEAEPASHRALADARREWSIWRRIALPPPQD